MIIVFGLFLCFAGNAFGADEPEGNIDFPDSNLKTALIDLGADADNDTFITEDEMALLGENGFGELILYSNNISNLTGLEYAVNFTKIYLDNNLISDLGPLSPMTWITSLHLSDNQIENIEPLSTLTNLTYLDLGQNRVTDLTPLSSLNQLQTLYIRNVDVVALDNLTPLSALTSLTSLWITGTTLSDISPLEGLVNLDNVDFQSNQISDISALHTLPKLNMISLDTNPISDISPLAGLNELQTLWLRYTKNVEDISALSGLPMLDNVYLDDNLISDLSPLSGSTSIRFLSVRDNRITDLSPLQTCTGLRYLWIDSNPVESLESLPQCPSLYSLSASTIKARDFSPLGSMTGLGELVLSFNLIEDMGFVSTMTGLTRLTLGYNHISDVPSLTNLTHLNSLFLNNNRLAILPENAFSTLTELSTLHIADNGIDLRTQVLHLPPSLSNGGFYYNNQYLISFTEPNDPISLDVGETVSRSIEADATRITASGRDGVTGEFTGVTSTDYVNIAGKCNVTMVAGDEFATVIKNGDQADVTGLALGTGKMALEWLDYAIGLYQPLVIRVTTVNVDDPSIQLPVLSFSEASATVNEGDSHVVYVERNLSLGAITCQVDVTGGTLSADEYTRSVTFPVTLSFANGETRKPITLSPLADGKTEGLEFLTLGIVRAGFEPLDPVPTFILDVADTSIRLNDARVVSMDFPATMLAYQDNIATITLENNGNTIWDHQASPFNLGNPSMPGDIYELKIGVEGTSPGDGPDDLEPGFAFVRTSTKEIVEPGEQVTYTFHITPKFTGNQTLKFKMLGLDINIDQSPFLHYFGETATLNFTVRQPIDDAQIISLDCPHLLLTEQSTQVTAVVKNTGETTWIPRSVENGSEWDWPGNTLVWYLDGDSSHPSCPPMVPGALFDWTLGSSHASVTPGETVTYTFTFTPRRAAVGEHVVHFRMLGLSPTNQYNYFGDTHAPDVEIKNPWNDARVVSMDFPTTMLAYQDNIATITLENNGTTTWDHQASPFNLGDPTMPGDIYELKIGVEGTSPGDGPDDLEPGFAFVRTSTKSVVTPGEQVTYTFHITPKFNGNQSLKFRMLGMDTNIDNSPFLEYFGETATLNFTVRQPVDDAQIISLNCPPLMLTERSTQVTAVVKNTGETTWIPRAVENGSEWDWPGNTLVWYLDGDSSHPSCPPMVPGALFDWTLGSSHASVAPGETVTYTYTFTPRRASEGEHVLHFRMLGLSPTDQYSYFGDASSKTVIMRLSNSVGIPTTVTLGGIEITLSGDSIHAPEGTDLASLLTQGTLSVPVLDDDGVTQIGIMGIELESVSGNEANLASAVLKLDMNRQMEGQDINVLIEVQLFQIPQSGMFEITLDPVESADGDGINSLLDKDGNAMEGLPLVIINVVKHNVDEQDIGPARVEIRMPKPPGFTSRQSFLMVKEDGQAMVILPTEFVEEGPLVIFRGSSPGGFSRFILVQLEDDKSDDGGSCFISSMH
ncbi:MAG: leucine-rich repeat domain-containing protein [Proteobacteria bacterium]|nr:leucine-rich repeat domain-containing protein [Pseudomonadota bacterium]